MNFSRIRFCIIFILLIALSAASNADNSAEYALIIIADGLRPDAIDKARTSNLYSLIKQASYTNTAKTVELAMTLPSLTSIITGLKPENHGMTGNKYSPDLGHTQFVTIFSAANKDGLSTAMFVGKDKLGYLNVPGSLDHYESTNMAPDSVELITQSYTGYLKKHKPRLALVHFPYPDLAGHKHGWMSGEYMDSLESVDKALGKIIASLKETGIYDNAFIVIVSDHGGEGKTHLKDMPNTRLIPWLAIGKNVKKDYRISWQVYIYDTAPTVLRALGLTPPPGIDGRVIEEIFLK